MNKQRGFTLIELMVGLTIGLIVMAGVLKFLSSILQANTESVKQQKFEQTVHALVGTIAADIRRAGYTPLGQAVPTLTVGGVNVGSFYA
ncbi:PulJ/GspJ family protein, partial [Aeromonas media]